jgi:hypothetical protein
MDKRNERRFEIIENLKGGFSVDNIRLEFDIAGPVEAKVVDISASGIGFKIENVEPRQLSFEADKTLFVKIIVIDEVLLIEAKVAWFSEKKTGNSHIINGGLKIEILSNEDRMKLAKIIENIRKNQIF